jgi:molecular chaperone DnaK (HSP70)
MGEKIVGIDLGATNSLVAYVDGRFQRLSLTRRGTECSLLSSLSKETKFLSERRPRKDGKWILITPSIRSTG